MKSSAIISEANCNDSKGLMKRAHVANNTNPRWREGFDGDSGLMAIFGVGLILSSNYFTPWLSQSNIISLVAGFALLTAGLMKRGRVLEFPLWGVVVDDDLRVLDGCYWMTSKIVQPEESLEKWREHFPDSHVRLIDLGYHKTYVSKTDLELLAIRNLASG